MKKLRIRRLAIDQFLNKFASLFLLVVLFSNCYCSDPPGEGPAEVASKFVRSFVTADTALFNSTVEIDSVVEHLNKNVWQEDYSNSLVRQILFFHYAPLKISMKRLQERVNHPFPYSHFEFDSVNTNGSSIRAIIRWQEIYDDSLKSLVITLYEKEPKIWKIKAIDYPKVVRQIRTEDQR